MSEWVAWVAWVRGFVGGVGGVGPQFFVVDQREDVGQNVGVGGIGLRCFVKKTLLKISQNLATASAFWRSNNSKWYKKKLNMESSNPEKPRWA